MNGITKLRYGLTIVLAMLAIPYLYPVFSSVISIGETDAYESAASEIFYKLDVSEQAAVTKYYTALPDLPKDPTTSIYALILGLMMIAAIILLFVITLLAWNAKEIRGE